MATLVGELSTFSTTLGMSFGSLFFSGYLKTMVSFKINNSDIMCFYYFLLFKVNHLLLLDKILVHQSVLPMS